MNRTVPIPPVDGSSVPVLFIIRTPPLLYISFSIVAVRLPSFVTVNETLEVNLL